MYRQLSLFGKPHKQDKKRLEIRERVESYGISALLNREAIAFLCSIEPQKLEGIETFEDLRNRYQLLPITKLQKHKLEAIFNLSVRISTERARENPVIKCPQDAADLVIEEMRHLKHEEFRILLLNTKHKVLGTKTISIGSLTECIVPPQIVLREAIVNNCHSIICLHPHPSGDPSPSSEDISVTKRLQSACKIMGIKLLDHIVIGDGKFVSLKERGILEGE